MMFEKLSKIVADEDDHHRNITIAAGALGAAGGGFGGDHLYRHRLEGKVDALWGVIRNEINKKPHEYENTNHLFVEDSARSLFKRLGISKAHRVAHIGAGSLGAGALAAGAYHYATKDKK